MGKSGRNTVVRGGSSAGLTPALGAPGFAGRADQPWKDASHCPSPYRTLTGVMKSHTLCPAPGSSQGQQAFILPPRLSVQHLKSRSLSIRCSRVWRDDRRVSLRPHSGRLPRGTCRVPQSCKGPLPTPSMSGLLSKTSAYRSRADAGEM